mgnify:CR=1 FL=1
MTRQSIETNKKIHKIMKNFTVAPFEEVSKNLAAATRKTVKALDKEKRIKIKGM